MELDREYWLVKAEIHRIQTYLFSVPRLASMIGANVLLGELVRIRLPALYRTVSSLPADTIAECQDERLVALQPIAADPLEDKPLTDFADGILARDGGHFRALFVAENEALSFIDKANQLVLEELPGLEVVFELQSLSEHGGTLTVTERNSPTPVSEAIVQLPQFEICQASGTEIASPQSAAAIPDSLADIKSSARVQHLTRQSTRFRRQQGRDDVDRCRDIVSEIHSRLPGDKLRNPADVSELSHKGYLALVVIDGNNIGGRQKNWMNQHLGEGLPTFGSIGDYLGYEAIAQGFFHGMRAAMRIAFVDAMNKTFTNTAIDDSKPLPYQVLMFGGDDLVLLTKPLQAFEFVVAFAKALQKASEQVLDSHGKPQPYSTSAGVAVASHSLPFFRLHETAVDLLESAKALYRAQSKDENGARPEHSTVDWAISTASWFDSPLQQRRKEDIVRYRCNDQSKLLLTTEKPYFVLPHGDEASSTVNSFESLFNEAMGVLGQLGEDEPDVARSQLKSTIRRLPEGCLSARTAFAQMPESTRKALGSRYGELGESLWRPVTPNEATWSTSFRDFIDLLELGYLGGAGIDGAATEV